MFPINHIKRQGAGLTMGYFLKFLKSSEYNVITWLLLNVTGQNVERKGCTQGFEFPVQVPHK